MPASVARKAQGGFKDDESGAGANASQKLEDDRRWRGRLQDLGRGLPYRSRHVFPSVPSAQLFGSAHISSHNLSHHNSKLLQACAVHAASTMFSRCLFPAPRLCGLRGLSLSHASEG